ncbi:MAG: ABC transporter permease, partial [Acidobacteriota bacterium]
PDARLAQARRVAGIAAVVPLRVGGRLWRNPQSGNSSELLMLGVVPADSPFTLPAMSPKLRRLSALDTVLFDGASHPSLGAHAPGALSELYGQRLRVIDSFSWGAGFVADGLAVTSRRSFERIFDPPPGEVEMGLVQLEPGASAERVAERLRALLPADTKVWTRRQVEARDRAFFLTERPIGLMFLSGVALAVLVGGVILFQILASEVTSRKAELATLQALGYSRRDVYRVVVEQGVLYTLFAFLPASLAAGGLFAVTSRLARLPMRLDLTLLAGVFFLSLLMCLLGAFFASHRVRSADPADLF